MEIVGATIWNAADEGWIVNRPLLNEEGVVDHVKIVLPINFWMESRKDWWMWPSRQEKAFRHRMINCVSSGRLIRPPLFCSTQRLAPREQVPKLLYSVSAFRSTSSSVHLRFVCRHRLYWAVSRWLRMCYDLSDGSAGIFHVLIYLLCRNACWTVGWNPCQQ